MTKIVAYLRTSTDKQDLNNQKLEILEYARSHKLNIDDFIQISISSKRTTKDRRIEEMMSVLNGADTLIVTELSRLGRSTAEIIGLVNELLKKKVRVIVAKQNMDIKQHDMNSKIMTTVFSLFAELERDLIGLRTKEALASKKRQGVKLGKPIGTIQKSKFDKDVNRIKDLLVLGLSVKKISNHLGYNSHLALNTYINKRKLRQETPKQGELAAQELINAAQKLEIKHS